MAQDGAIMGFHPMSCQQHYVQAMEKTPQLPPSKNVIPVSFHPYHDLSPNAGRIHLFRKGLTSEPLRSQLGIYNSTGSLTQKIIKMSNSGSGSCPISGRVTAPCTPLKSSPCPSGNQVPLAVPVTGGQSSVVTFRFIEKANVKTLNGFPLIESRKENGLSRSLESEEDFHFEANKQRSRKTNAQTQYSLQHKVTASLNPVILDNGMSFKAPTDKSSLTTTDEQDPVVLSSKQERLGFKPKPEISASDPLLAGNRFLSNAQPSLSWGNGTPLSLGASCPPSSLTGELSSLSNDLLCHRRHPQNKEPQYQGSLWAYSHESSAHAQRVAKAKWEFFYGSVESPKTGMPSQNALDPSPQLLEKSKLSAQENPDRLRPEHSLCHVEVEIEMTPSPGNAKFENCETGIIRRTVKYSETDLDSVPLRCYHETNIDDILAEKEEVDSAIESQKDSESNFSSTGIPRKANIIPNDLFFQQAMEEDSKALDNKNHGNKDGEISEAMVHHQDRVINRNTQLIKSPVPFLFGQNISKDSMDSFSKHFESIMESHRAKGTSYTSLDSIDILSSPTPIQNGTVFTFDLPTLTPEIQEEIQDSAKTIEQNFAPLALLDPDSGTSSATDVPWTEREEDARQKWKSSLQSPCHSEGSLGIPLASIISKHHLSQLVSDSDSEMDSTEQLALGSTDTLSSGHNADLEAARRLAKRLYNLDGFKKADVARHLGKNNDFSKTVAGEYLKFFEFTGMTLDQALRSFLKELALMGETQERERILAHFSQRYYECNPKTIPSEDGAHTLACALMLLNTDLHGHNIGKRMSCSDFIGNLEGLNQGSDFPRELLKAVYSSIKNEKLQWAIDEEELRKSLSELADPNSKSIKCISSCSNPFLDFSQDPSIAMYKYGFLVRKSHAEPDCKKTPRGKRGWKTFHGILKGMILYLQKEEYKPGQALAEEDLKNAISIHHSLATQASDYNKRPNVFYLRTADWRVFLFQAQNAEQMHSWITRINVVAAMFSAPPFPAAIGSQKKFTRPLLPSSSTRLSQEEQLKSHEIKFKAMAAELLEHRSSLPEKKVKGKEYEELKQKEEYLIFEKLRYGIYATLMRTKLKTGSEDLAALEATLFVTVGNSEDSFKESQSSLPLNQEPAATGSKIKCNNQ
ncbi:PH and SEC7 domain-containing protein 1 [Pantherophis guttatus]|uniref:PH and SEC7 domain-containing protein 1 n=1 Tax=Pantherophis guttatus TaxID=94885 RepID=A0A6P9CNX7_PANGU|nr:PH and SEC7 domain-containing protein 1 [Pantherophis guttatus]